MSKSIWVGYNSYGQMGRLRVFFIDPHSQEAQSWPKLVEYVPKESPNCDHSGIGLPGCRICDPTVK